MAHVTLRGHYAQLVERLNRFPQGAPPSEVLYGILKLLFSEREAGLVARLPIRPFTVRHAALVWGLDVAATQQVLDDLASRAILLDTVTPDGQITYILPPPMAGFFEFSLMRVRGDVDQQALSELYYQYITVEDEFIRALLINGETQLGRVFVQEQALPAKPTCEVLDYERASEVIRTATHRGVGVCYCRHKMQHIGRNCSAPLNICLTFNGCAAALIRHEFAREVDTAEGLALLQEAQDRGLVQFGENGRESVSFICNCCGCCCEAMIAQRRFGLLHPIHTSNYLPRLDLAACNGCGKCTNACPVEAMTLVSANDPHLPKLRRAKVDDDLCLGCGVCVRACPKQAIRLEARAARVLTPLNTVHRTVVMAIERGLLPQLIFDNQALASHRAMAAILGVILQLPPLKQALASRQLKSRYLERLLAWGAKRYTPA